MPSQPTTPAQSAVQRLEQSRERMRVWLDERTRPARFGVDGKRSGGAIGSTLNAWLDGLRRNPVAEAVIDALQGWWASHPLNSALRIADEAAGDVMTPLIKRHPIALITGAFIIGAISTRAKPWRWFARRALLAGLVSQLTSRLLAQGPLEFLLGALRRVGKQRNNPQTQAAGPADRTSSDTAEPDPAEPSERLAVQNPSRDRQSVAH